mmetsp:Transcript_49444/g.119975  ORF Transcript_49444/g.119975 Transcript_49444/m.119975 type:complete len:240 (+) Transcript_49444:275-994(+)
MMMVTMTMVSINQNKTGSGEAGVPSPTPTPATILLHLAAAAAVAPPPHREVLLPSKKCLLEYCLHQSYLRVVCVMHHGRGRCGFRWYHHRHAVMTIYLTAARTTTMKPTCPLSQIPPSCKLQNVCWKGKGHGETESKSREQLLVEVEVGQKDQDRKFKFYKSSIGYGQYSCKQESSKKNRKTNHSKWIGPYLERMITLRLLHRHHSYSRQQSTVEELLHWYLRAGTSTTKYYPHPPIQK